MEIVYTKDPAMLAAWDAFVFNEDKASHLILSDWVLSYKSYGFDSDFCLALADGKVIGGFAAVVAKAMMFKFYIVPYGPIVSAGHEQELEPLIAAVQERAKHFNASYCHITLPVSNADNSHVYRQLPSLRVLEDAKPGHLFRYVYSSSGLNWIDLRGFDEESKIMTLKPAVRRNIRNSYRKDLAFAVLDSYEKLEEGYRLFIENSRAAGYSIRSWDEIRESLFALLDKNAIKMLAAYKNGEIKGAILLVKAGNYYTYILGGSKKEVPDLRTGDFLQWEAVKLSLAEGLDGYNISLGGSKGVVEFKNSFGTEQLLFEGSKYHWVLRPALFNTYVFLDKHMKPYKKQIAGLLAKFRR
jgi:lipid II:glycine glycyltransferase (peptidoglycan interpeptide bridge formation enzyme)